MGQEHKLDARGVAILERFHVITGKLGELAEGDSLLLINDFEPAPLYGELRSQGFTYDSRQVGPLAWHIEIRKSSP